MLVTCVNQGSLLLCTIMTMFVLLSFVSFLSLSFSSSLFPSLHLSSSLFVSFIRRQGPFINKLKKGAHAETLVASPVDGKDSVMAMYGSLDSVSMVTIAPELEGAQDAIVAMADAGVIVAVGHSMAAMHQAEDAVDHGKT